MIPLVSVVMSCYNESETIERAIESILNQSFADFEFIIVDDCSTDDTYSICRRYAGQDSRLKVLQTNENSGFCAKPLNIGIENARANLIARMDGDDYSYPARLACQYDFLMQHPDVDILGTGVRLLSKESGRDMGEHVLPEHHADIIKRRYKGTMCYHPTVMVRRSVYEKMGGYNDKAFRVEDLDLWLRSINLFRFHNLPDILLDFYKRENAMNLNDYNAFVAGNRMRFASMKLNNDWIVGLPEMVKRYINYYFLKRFR